MFSKVKIIQKVKTSWPEAVITVTEESESKDGRKILQYLET